MSTCTSILTGSLHLMWNNVLTKDYMMSQQWEAFKGQLMMGCEGGTIWSKRV